MFTGIIREVGNVTDVTRVPHAMTLTVATPMSSKVTVGSSVAVSGACLTVLARSAETMKFRLMQETITKTNLGLLTASSAVNLESPLTIGATLDGHYITGHVDGTAEIEGIAAVGEDRVITFRPPPPLNRYFVPKGSVALNGVSLTIVAVNDDSFTVSFMPYTLEHTTFGNAKVGDLVNLEVDMIAKQIVTFIEKSETQMAKLKSIELTS